MSLSRVGLSVLRGVRNRSTTAPVYPGYGKTGVIKEKFGLEDATPVFKKGGTFDRIIYGSTFIVCATGVGFSINAYYQFSLK